MTELKTCKQCGGLKICNCGEEPDVDFSNENKSNISIKILEKDVFK